LDGAEHFSLFPSCDVGEFRELEVYRRAAALAHELQRSVTPWPSFEKWSVGLQLVRAADSIGANIAEAEGRYGPADQRRLFFIARGSAFELQHWLDRAANSDMAVPPQAITEAGEIGRMLNGLLQRLPHHRTKD
jgi:four helix bundle protein